MFGVSGACEVTIRSGCWGNNNFSSSRKESTSEGEDAFEGSRRRVSGGGSDSEEGFVP